MCWGGMRIGGRWRDDTSEFCGVTYSMGWIAHDTPLSDMIREIFELLDVPRQDPGESKKRSRADIDTGTWDGFSEEVYLTNGWNEDVWQDFQSYLVGLNIWSGERM